MTPREVYLDIYGAPFIKMVEDWIGAECAELYTGLFPDVDVEEEFYKLPEGTTIHVTGELRTPILAIGVVYFCTKGDIRFVAAENASPMQFFVKKVEDTIR